MKIHLALQQSKDWKWKALPFSNDICSMAASLPMFVKCWNIFEHIHVYFCGSLYLFFFCSCVFICSDCQQRARHIRQISPDVLAEASTDAMGTMDTAAPGATHAHS